MPLLKEILFKTENVSDLTNKLLEQISSFQPGFTLGERAETIEKLIKATFLGAHAVPLKYKNNKKEYLKLIAEEMIPLVAKDNVMASIVFILYFNFKESIISIKENLSIIGYS